MRYVNAIHVSVILYSRNHCRFPIHTVVSLRRLHSNQFGVLELNNEARALAKVSPDCVARDFSLGRALGLEDIWGRLKPQYEAVFVVNGFLSHANSFKEQVGYAPGVQSLMRSYGIILKLTAN